MRINDTYPEPVHHANRGYAHAHLYGANRGPVAIAAPTPRSERRLSRAQARAFVQARREDARSGADFLRSLTLTHNQ